MGGEWWQRRTRVADAAVGVRRISRPAFRRHCDQPGRDRAPGRSWHRCRSARHARGQEADRGKHLCCAPAHRRADRRRNRLRQFRRAGTGRRGPGRSAPPVPSFRRGRSGAACPWLAPARRADPAAGGRQDGRARRLRPHRARAMGRARHGQAGHVRGHRGAVARLYRRRLARHALGDRRRADTRRRHRGAEGEVSVAHRLGRDPADGGVHRAQYRLRPGELAHAGGAGRRHLQDPGQQDLDHARGPCRHHDACWRAATPRSPATRACRCSWRKSRAARMPSRFRPRA